MESTGTLKVPSHVGSAIHIINQSLNSPHQLESTLMAPAINGGIISSTRIPMPSSSLAGSNADRHSGAMMPASSSRHVEAQSAEDGQSNGAFTLDAGNATMKTDGILHNHHKKHHKKHNHSKNSTNTRNTKKIQFDESVETEEELKKLSEEEIKLRRREANLMELVKKAANKSQASLSEEQQAGDYITLNSVSTNFQNKTAVGQIFNSVKDEYRFLGDYAFKHFYIDYDLQREKKFTWESITNNLLNS